jgi:uncharacterized membrane protein YdjX (TVP38/TMEM64 family)
MPGVIATASSPQHGTDARARCRSALRLIAIGVLLAAAAWILRGWLVSARGAAGLRDQYGGLGALMLAVVQGVVSATPLPGETIAFTASAVYGFWTGVAVSWCGWMVGAFLQYVIARYVLCEFQLDALRAKLPPRLRRVPVQHPAFLIFGRFVPLGFDLVNATAGAFRVP